jgi:uncharacterized protein (DUF4415 family)
MKNASKRVIRDLTDEEEAAVQRGIAQDPDNPEMTAEEIRAMRPAREVLPREFFELVERERKRRGRPPAAGGKQQVTLRLDTDVLERLRAEGAGWQSRINAMLRKAVGL